MNLGDRIRTARTERGWTQPQLAKRLGIRQSALSMLEAGEFSASPDLVARVKAWLESGGRPPRKGKRGPYKVRKTV